MTNPLIVEAENEDAAAPGFDGAGVLSSWADLNKAVSSDHVDPLEVVFTAAAAGLDTLGAIDDPFGCLIGAGIGWLIEHVWFLHEPLDALCGDPTQITAQAKTWNNVAGELGKIAAEHRAATPTTAAWDGAAGEAYRAKVQEYTGGLDSAAGAAQLLSSLILTTGAGVGTVRSIIRDAIVEFLTYVVEYVLASIALAALTAGGSLGACVVSVVVRAIDLAADFSRRISALLDALHAAGGTARQLSEAMRMTAGDIQVAAHIVRTDARAISDAADEVDAGKFIEAGKQLTAAGQEQRGWRADPVPAP